MVLSGEKLAATCGMDLHGNSTLHGHYSTYIQGEPHGDVCQELSDAIHNQCTWVCKGPLLEVHNDGEALTFTIHQTGKPGYEPLIGDDYKITLRTKDRVITCNVSDRIPLASFAEHAIIIPMLFEKETIIENLVCNFRHCFFFYFRRIKMLIGGDNNGNFTRFTVKINFRVQHLDSVWGKLLKNIPQLAQKTGKQTAAMSKKLPSSGNT